MKCTICGMHIDSIEEAIEKKWTLTFYEKSEMHGPSCWDCSRSLLEVCENGEFVVKEAYMGKIIYQEEFIGSEDPEMLSMGLIFN